jgi:hypothetical protein
MYSVYLTAYEASPTHCLDNGCLKSDRGQIFHLVNSSTHSRLFVMFIFGCEKRMGRLVKQDLGVSIKMLEELLKLYDIELREELTTMARKRKIVICTGTFVILFTVFCMNF